MSDQNDSIKKLVSDMESFIALKKIEEIEQFAAQDISGFAFIRGVRTGFELCKESLEELLL